MKQKHSYCSFYTLVRVITVRGLLFFLALFFVGCSISKRKHLKGWYVNKSVSISSSHSVQNEKEFKLEGQPATATNKAEPDHTESIKNNQRNIDTLTTHPPINLTDKQVITKIKKPTTEKPIKTNAVSEPDPEDKYEKEDKFFDLKQGPIWFRILVFTLIFAIGLAIALYLAIFFFAFFAFTLILLNILNIAISFSLASIISLYVTAALLAVLIITFLYYGLHEFNLIDNSFFEERPVLKFSLGLILVVLLTQFIYYYVPDWLNNLFN